MKRGQIVVTVLLIAAIAVVLAFFPSADPLLALTAWADAHPVAAWPVFSAIFALAVVLMSPAWPFMLAAGYLFGPGLGVVLASLANLFGAVAAFLLARYVGGAAISERVHRMPRFAALSRAIVHNGLLVVALSRAAVIIPHNLLNYAYGFTAVRFWHYLIGSWIGTLPVIVLPVLIGSRAGDLASLFDGEGEVDKSGLLMFSIILGLLIVVVLLLTRLASRFLKRELG